MDAFQSSEARRNLNMARVGGPFINIYLNDYATLHESLLWINII